MDDLDDDESDVRYNVRKLEGEIMNYFRDRIQVVRENKSRQIYRNLSKSTRNIRPKKQFDYQFSTQNNTNLFHLQK